MIVSIVIPCYRSELTIRTVVGEIKDTVSERKGWDYQIVLVNDCSPDNTFSVIKELCSEDRKIIGVDMSRNFGQETAIVAGLGYASGDAVVVMDDDGQHPTKEMWKLIDKMQEGYDIVYAAFPHKHHSWFKRFTSDLHGVINEWIGCKPKGIILSSFWCLSPFCAKELSKYHSPFTSRGGYLMRITQKFANVEIDEHRDRLAGSSGYNLKKMLELWFSNFTNFSIVPIRAMAKLGWIIAAMGFLFGIYLVIRKLFDPSVAIGYTSIMSVILFIGGIIIAMIGFIGEYIGRTYMTVSGMPQFIVRQSINTEKDE
ncbi:MAG: glycosyltransferase [Oscillospiraceae bacterium]|nr:glycosyltransferase [Oscillospiraceae bacterium]MBR0451052.1 glycosyltransferase [Oscillospiraceae bacterium]